MGGNIMTEKRFNVFDVDGTVFLEDHIEGSYHIGEKENVDIPCLNDIADRLNTYAEENEQLKQQIKKLESQLYCPYDSICINCVNEYLVQKDKYYVSKCKKGHEQCSRTDVKYCDDFELKGDVE